MFSLPLSVEEILRSASKQQQGRTTQALWCSSDEPGVEDILHCLQGNITDEDELHGWYSGQTCQPLTLMVVRYRVNGNADADELWESPPPVGAPLWFPIDPEQAAPESEIELDPPVSDAEVNESRKRRTSIPKLNQTFQEWIAKSRWCVHCEFDNWDVLKRHHRGKFPALSIQAKMTRRQLKDRFLTQPRVPRGAQQD